MGEVALSKSKYCRAKQCNKMLWLDKNMPEVSEKIDNETVFANGHKVGELAKGLFGAYVDIQLDKNFTCMIEQTKKHMQAGAKIITEASFEYNNNFCSVDILKNGVDGVEIYEVKSSTEIKDIYYDDVSYQMYVLNKCGYKVVKANIVYLNREYIRQGDLDLNELFIIKDVTDIALARQIEIEQKIKEINEYMQNKEEQVHDITMNCFEPYDCVYWKYCTKHLPKNNVFGIAGMRKTKKVELYNEGVWDFKELLKENINNKYKQQIEFELYNLEPFIDKEQVREFMKTLYYPLYFLDFETYQSPIPEYDGVNPYMQIPFQYSLHIIQEENDKLKHMEFLAQAGIDPRRSFAESLVNNVPDNVCVLAYNMTFEKMIIKQMALLYPDLESHLMCIHNNMKDLMIPFSTRAYYTKEMQGSYSIKKVLPALFPNEPSLDYHNLNMVHKGDEASAAYISLVDKTDEEQQTIRKALLEYCKLDTYAMVKIWEKLNEV